MGEVGEKVGEGHARWPDGPSSLRVERVTSRKESPTPCHLQLLTVTEGQSLPPSSPVLSGRQCWLLWLQPGAPTPPPPRFSVVPHNSSREHLCESSFAPQAGLDWTGLAPSTADVDQVLPLPLCLSHSFPLPFVLPGLTKCQHPSSPVLLHSLPFQAYPVLRCCFAGCYIPPTGSCLLLLFFLLYSRTGSPQPETTFVYFPPCIASSHSSPSPFIRFEYVCPRS